MRKRDRKRWLECNSFFKYYDTSAPAHLARANCVLRDHHCLCVCTEPSLWSSPFVLKNFQIPCLAGTEYYGEGDACANSSWGILLCVQICNLTESMACSKRSGSATGLWHRGDTACSVSATTHSSASSPTHTLTFIPHRKEGRGTASNS